MGKLAIPSIVANGGSGGGGGGSATWGNISGTLSDQTDLQDALNGKANIDQYGEIDCTWLNVSDTNGSADLSCDTLDITTEAGDHIPATIYLMGGDGESEINLINSTNETLKISVDDNNGAQILKSDDNFGTTKSVLWEDQQSIKTYNAPSYTMDNNYGIIPNVDACTEVGMYKVVFETDQQAGGVGTFNYLLNVCITNMNNIDVISQTMIIPLTNGTGYIYRVGFNGTYQAWEGKILDTELAKCLQNSATGTNSVAILTNGTTTNNNSSIIINPRNVQETKANEQTVIGDISYGSLARQGITALGYHAIPYQAYSIAIGHTSYAGGTGAVSIGYNNDTSFGVGIGQYVKSGNASIAIGSGVSASKKVISNAFKAIAIGVLGSSDTVGCEANANEAIQLGSGVNGVAKQFQVYEYPMLDGTNGKIPNERLRITVADTSSTSATIANVEGGRDYTFSQALTALSITAITSSFVEANIYFTAGTSITVTLPQGTNTIGDFTFEPNKSYVISIQNGIAVRGELN